MAIIIQFPVRMPVLVEPLPYETVLDAEDSEEEVKAWAIVLKEVYGPVVRVDEATVVTSCLDD